MTAVKSSLDYLGPYAQQEPIAALSELTQQVWNSYHESAGGPVRKETQRQFFCSRMMYISEVMSRGVRINASWALTHAAMSLLRDRYEQSVRFSWLAKQKDATEFQKYLLHFHAKTRSLMKNVSPETRKRYEEIMGPLPAWVTQEINKEEEAKFRQWEAINLRELARRRDALAPVDNSLVAKEKLSAWYDPIYAQFSSVSHFDYFSIQLVGLHKTPDGTNVMSAEPHWPGLLILQNCFFDIIQCFEAAFCYHQRADSTISDKQLKQWVTIAAQMSLAPGSSQ